MIRAKITKIKKKKSRQKNQQNQKFVLEKINKFVEPLGGLIWKNRGKTQITTTITADSTNIESIIKEYY